ncbi:unnamed protein product [Coccothraustes coccothraustes]
MWDLIHHLNLAIPPVSAVPSPVYITGSAASPLPQPSCRWVIRALECWRSLQPWPFPKSLSQLFFAIYQWKLLSCNWFGDQVLPCRTP